MWFLALGGLAAAGGATRHDATVYSLEEAEPASNHQGPQLQKCRDAGLHKLDRVQHDVFEEEIEKPPYRPLALAPDATVQSALGGGRPAGGGKVLEILSIRVGQRW